MINDDSYTLTPLMLKSIFGLIALKGWGDLSLVDFAEHLDLPLDEFQRYVRSKEEILKALFLYIDTKAEEEVDEDLSDLPIQERVFDVIMTRFEVLDDYKPAVKRMWQESSNDPGLVLCGVPIGVGSMNRMWNRINSNSETPKNYLFSKGLGALYLSMIPVWLEDETEGLSKTMGILNTRIDKVLNVSRCVFPQGVL